MMKIKYRLLMLLIILLLVKELGAQNNTCKVLLQSISGNYTGRCVDGLAHGKGKATGEDTYTGMFFEGLPHGRGKYVFKNGNVYRGEFVYGRIEGRGKQTLIIEGKKITLSGNWENGDFLGSKEPEESFQVHTSQGLSYYRFETQQKATSGNKEIIIEITSALQTYLPRDLTISKTSGEIFQRGRRITINQYLLPFQCEISYTIVVGYTRKHCRFIFEILDESSYMVTLFTD
jgi:hypothetical protein